MNILDSILHDLYAEDLTSAYSCKQEINNECMRILALSDPSKEDLVEAKKLIDIGRICYENCDRDILPIEDGIYDLLIAFYGKHNNGVYPVGGAPIHFKSSNEKMIDKKEPEPAFIHVSDKDAKYMSEMIFPGLIYDGREYVKDDFVTNAFTVDQEYIQKRLRTVSHNNPDLVGTMDKCKYVLIEQARERGVENDSNVNIVERDYLQPLVRSGIIDPNKEYTIIAELKYDGISVEAECNTMVEEARSRGDTDQDAATDLTPIFRGYTFPKMYGHSLNHPIGIKFEAIVSYYNLYKINQMKNYNYINGRTAIIGLSSSSDAYRYRDLITLVPISTNMKDDNGEPLDRLVELEFLNKYFAKDQLMRYEVFTGNYNQILFFMKRFVEEAEFSRSYLPFMYDGVVFEFYDKELREKLGRDNSIDRYKVAVKFNPLKKQTIFRQYKYTIGQDGSVTPMIYYDPVEFFGSIHPKSTGSSYDRFKKLDLHVGDIIDVEYTNDVMPRVYKPDNEHNRKNALNPHNELDSFPTICPSCGQPLTISKTGKTVYCLNPMCGNRTVKRMTATLNKLGIAGFAEESVTAIGKSHISEYFDADVEEFAILGDGNKVNLRKQLDDIITKPINDYDYVGSLGFTGIAKKTWKIIFEYCNLSGIDIIDELLVSDDPVAADKVEKFLANIKGVGAITAATIVNECVFFYKDLEYIHKMNIVKTFPSADMKKIRFTNCRDGELVKKLRELGHDADGDAGVTKDTDYLLVPNTSINSSKVAKAKKYGVQIVSLQDFRDNLDSYL